MRTVWWKQGVKSGLSSTSHVSSRSHRGLAQKVPSEVVAMPTLCYTLQIYQKDTHSSHKIFFVLLFEWPNTALGFDHLTPQNSMELKIGHFRSASERELQFEYSSYHVVPSTANFTSIGIGELIEKNSELKPWHHN